MVRESRGLVTAAGPAAEVTAGGTPSGGFLGVLRVGVADLPALAEAAEHLASRAAARPAAQPGEPLAALADPLAADQLLAALVAAGRRVAACRLRLLVADRAADEPRAAAVRAADGAVDEDAARLRLAVKERDDFFTTYFVSPVSPHVVRWAARLGLSPTAVTGISVAVAVARRAGLRAGRRRPAMVAGAVLLYLGFVLDCVDGQLARYTRQFSAFGGWLDTMADRAKEYAGLRRPRGRRRAARARRTAWPLAIAAMVLQTVRHMTDTWYGALHDEAAARPGGRGGRRRRGRPAERGVRTGCRPTPGSVAYWLKRIVVFPIGERWALIALTAALFNGRVALLAVLVWGVLAAAYTLASAHAAGAARCGCRCWTTVDTAPAPRRRPAGPRRAGRRPTLPPRPLAVAARRWPLLAALAAGGGAARPDGDA